jgi:hypothetical protein
MDVGAAVTANGASAPKDGLDTSSWFESQIPPAAEQPEAKIELSSIADVPMPPAPSLARATEEVKETPQIGE